MNQPISRLVVRYTGHVQGVFFRQTAIDNSDGLAVNGFVRNEPDGSVLMDVEGTDADLRELMNRIAEAKRNNIDSIDVVSESPLDRTDGFAIEY